MKKLTYLLLALLIFACSSDDSSDDSSDGNQLFLEKYDGFVWRWSDQPYEDRKITFSSNILGLIIFGLDQDGEEHEIEYSDIVRYD